MYIVTVSTIKDTIGNIQEFVDLNLASGVNHLFIFLDGGHDAAMDHFKKNPYITCVNADDEYWNHNRPESLNARQSINATTVNFLLSILNFRCWLFHIDGDECLNIDVEKLKALPKHVDFVRLMPLESLADEHQVPKNKIQYFKRLLNKEELSLLTALHVIELPNNQKYYKGHVAGKVGLIPNFYSTLRIHTADFRSEKKAYRSPWLNHLHFDALSLDGFLEKWKRNSQANKIFVRGDRALIRDAMFCLSGNKLIDSSRKAELMRKIYMEHIQQREISLLMELGLLKARNPLKEPPAPLNPLDMEIIRTVLSVAVKLNRNKGMFTLMNFEPRKKLFRAICTESASLGVNPAFIKLA